MKKLSLFALNLISIVAVAGGFNTQLASDDPETPEVGIGQYLVASSSQYAAIQTAGVGPCIAVTLHDENAEVGALLHVSSAVHVYEAIQTVVSELVSKGADISAVKAQLLGGWDDSMALPGSIGSYDSDRMVQQLREALSAYQIKVTRDITLVKPSEIGPSRPMNLNVELDLSSGSAYLYQQSVEYEDASPATLLPGAFGTTAPL